MNPLFAAMSGGNNMFSAMQNARNMVSMFRGQNPAAVMQMMAQRNPQFAQFMQSCQGKTPEQVCQEYGVDIEQLRQMMR